MKLSISWIFDHLQASWKDISVPDLAHKLTMTTAEIERVTPLTVDVDTLTAVQVTGVDKGSVTVFSPEWDKEFTLPARPDAHQSKVFLATKDSWAAFPALSMLDADLAGGWKKKFEAKDYLLELDNVALTHRPDLWSHRGFAREIGAIINIPLKPLEQMLAHIPSGSHTIPVEVKDPKLVPHYSGLYIAHIESGDSLLPIAHRLSRVDVRPHAAIVDTTNYVMLDIGQPQHAMDAKGIQKIIVRVAKPGETLQLRDGQKLELSSELIIATEQKPIAVAGVTGDEGTIVTPSTESIFLESSTFDSATVRRAVTRSKIRTESSTRFEKGVSPYNNLIGIQRFVKLMHDSGLAMKITDGVVSVGTLPGQPTIELEHALLEARIGMQVKPEQGRQALEKLEFTVRENKGIYQVTVPVHRLKDVTIPEDLIEEIVRSIGYQMIQPQAPAIALMPHDLRPVMNLRRIKQHFSSACAMHEIATYSLFDEPFLHKLGCSPERVALRNPVSEHFTSLVTSLIPNLLKAVTVNEHKQEQLRFFECARVWAKDTQHASGVSERKVISGIFFDRKNPVDFYECKALVAGLFDLLEISVTYAPVQQAPLFNPFQTAAIFHKHAQIGVIGMLDAPTVARVAQGSAFAFELDLGFLQSWHIPHKKFNPISKYPAVWLDVSMLVPLSVTVAQMTETIAKVDARIESVSLIDFFEKKEWADKRSLTFRYVVEDHTKTFEKTDIAALEQAVHKTVTSLGGQIR